MGSARRLRLGTRGSRLALVQSELVAARLRANGVPVEVKTIVSDGDLRAPETPIGEGIFVTALERALVAGEIDLAVHSAKDLPLDEDPQLVIAAYPERADARDALVTRRAERSVEDLAIGAKVGTDSPRRAGFLRALRADLDVIPLHGNVDTRLRRLDAGEADALLLAAAGLDRLGLGARIATRLDPESMPPAPAQGALAVQARREDQEVLDVVGRLDDAEIRIAVVAERAILKAMGGGCRAPVGAVAVQVDGDLTLLAAAVSPDGRARHVTRIRHHLDGDGSLARSLSLAAKELNTFVPLRGHVVIDTRPEVEESEREAMASDGFRVLHIPSIAIRPAKGNGGLDRARSRIADYDWVVLTSKRGVAALFDGLSAVPSSVRWAAVGATTAKALQERGAHVDCVPASARGAAIPSAMATLGSLNGRRILLARADAADRALPQKLQELGAQVDDVVAYQTDTAPEASRRAVLKALAARDVEAIMFASGSAAKGIVELAGGEADRARAFALLAITIGPKTSGVARELGFKVAAEAETQDAAGLRAALRRAIDEEVERWVESQLRQPA
ncbi:MAG: hydroxymethylbilane synthase [Actinobacteria bacterium 13_1_20CM_2_65_11]|nr:MAG: hydroxymethylbilane synthase [Actinobacteria bacterium 13_1_40CM_2_65_8]OLE80820.1 MAG: hydroxymethylbilane synthase [Actinobacteria bacterium 13_1_20CM_2_65_11]